MFKKINILLILLFLFAFWLFKRGGTILGFLKNPELAEKIREAKGEMSFLNIDLVTAGQLIDLLLISSLAGLLCLLSAIIISLLICWKRNHHWINAFLAFILFMLLMWLNISMPQPFVEILKIPGSFLNGTGYFIINGGVRLLSGLLIFYLTISEGLQNKHKILIAQKND
jgi:hypothetical protein